MKPLAKPATVGGVVVDRHEHATFTIVLSRSLSVVGADTLFMGKPLRDSENAAVLHRPSVMLENRTFEFVQTTPSEGIRVS